jgi:hypothetical protein
MNYLSICCIAKDEHAYIREWVDHHLAVGAEKIIVYDNESDPPLNTALREHIEHGLVDIHAMPGQARQLLAYDHCLKTYAAESVWIAFIDVDECLIPKSQDDARLILCDYEEFGGLGVHWVEFGSSGHLKRPSPSQLSSYVQRFPLEYGKHMHIKSIVQPSKTLEPFDPHKFIFREPWYCVDENFYPIAESQGPFTAARIQLNHYYYRSQQDYCQKLDRGRADRIDEAGKRKHEDFHRQAIKAVIFDDSGLRHGRNLESRFSDFEALRMFVQDRTRVRQEFDAYFGSILRLISAGKTDTAMRLIRQLVVSGANKDVTDYAMAKIHHKNGDLETAMAFLRKILSRHPDYDVGIEYASLLIKTGKLDEARSTLRYVQWKFRDIIKKETGLQRSIDTLMEKTNKPFVNG